DNALGAPDMTAAPEVQARVAHLVGETRFTLDAIRSLAGKGVDAWVDPPSLAKAVATGILDAPQLMNNPFGRGHIRTRIVNGGCEVVDESGRVLPEAQRLSQLS
ncbi:MAG TPA: methionine synthase, partial [Anaerolineales bacterium]|nr:methionine synthase [Anaerolineales bacterium]